MWWISLHGYIKSQKKYKINSHLTTNPSKTSMTVKLNVANLMEVEVDIDQLYKISLANLKWQQSQGALWEEKSMLLIFLVELVCQIIKHSLELRHILIHVYMCKWNKQHWYSLETTEFILHSSSQVSWSGKMQVGTGMNDLLSTTQDLHCKSMMVLHVNKTLSTL